MNQQKQRGNPFKRQQSGLIQGIDQQGNFLGRIYSLNKLNQSLDEESLNMSKSLFCPFSQHRLKEPVVLSDGYSYQKQYIPHLFNSQIIGQAPNRGQQYPSSPVTSPIIPSHHLDPHIQIANKTLYFALEYIEQYMQKERCQLKIKLKTHTREINRLMTKLNEKQVQIEQLQSQNQRKDLQIEQLKQQLKRSPTHQNRMTQVVVQNYKRDFQSGQKNQKQIESNALNQVRIQYEQQKTHLLQKSNEYNMYIQGQHGQQQQNSKLLKYKSPQNQFICKFEDRFHDQTIKAQDMVIYIPSDPSHLQDESSWLTESSQGKLFQLDQKRKQPQLYAKTFRGFKPEYHKLKSGQILFLNKSAPLIEFHQNCYMIRQESIRMDWGLFLSHDWTRLQQLQLIGCLIDSQQIQTFLDAARLFPVLEYLNLRLNHIRVINRRLSKLRQLKFLDLGKNDSNELTLQSLEYLKRFKKQSKHVKIIYKNKFDKEYQ